MRQEDTVAQTLGGSRPSWCRANNPHKNVSPRCLSDLCPGGVGGRAQHDTAGMTGDLGGQGEDPQSELLGFPPACGVFGEGEHLGPDPQVMGHLVHRDVKPANVLVAPLGPGRGEFALLGSFGIALESRTGDGHGRTRPTPPLDAEAVLDKITDLRP